jgi:hypothetical protein
MTSDNLDRISEILEAHLGAVRRQLDLFHKGFRLDNQVPGIPRTEQELLERIEHLETSLARHQERWPPG